jgi:hypothetical protein
LAELEPARFEAEENGIPRYWADDDFRSNSDGGWCGLCTSYTDGYCNGGIEDSPGSNACPNGA